MLPSWNKGLKNLCVSISKIDDIAYGRGVSSHGLMDLLFLQEDTELCLNSMEDRFLSNRNTRNVIYQKVMSFNFRSGMAYVIEAIPERKPSK